MNNKIMTIILIVGLILNSFLPHFNSFSNDISEIKDNKYNLVDLLEKDVCKNKIGEIDDEQLSNDDNHKSSSDFTFDGETNMNFDITTHETEDSYIYLNGNSEKSSIEEPEYDERLNIELTKDFNSDNNINNKTENTIDSTIEMNENSEVVVENILDDLLETANELGCESLQNEADNDESADDDYILASCSNVDDDDFNVQLQDNDSIISNEPELKSIDAEDINIATDSTIGNNLTMENVTANICEDIISDISINNISTVSYLEKESLFGDSTGTTHILPRNWYDAFGGPKTYVTKIIFQKGGTIPSGSSWNISSTGLMGYYNSGIVTIYAPDTNDNIKATNCNHLFSGYGTDILVNNFCNLTEIENLSYLDVSSVTTMNAMFSLCSSLQSIDFSNFDTSSVTDMTAMFNNCIALNTLDLSTFDTSKVTTCTSMFHTCSNLKTIYVGDLFDLSSATSHGAMFTGDTSLVGQKGTACDGVNFINKTYARIDGGPTSATPGYFSLKPGLTVASISVATKPSKLHYMVGEHFDPNGLIIHQHYDDGHIVDVEYNGTTAADFTFNPAPTFDLTLLDTVVTIGYGGLQCTLNIFVVEISSISIISPATKDKYKKGESFDPSGLVISINYSDGRKTPIMYDATTSGDFAFIPSVPFDAAGIIPVTISHSGKTCTQDVEVIAPQSITVKTAPSKLKYAIGETFNPTGLKVNLIYSDTTTIEEVAYAGNETNFSFNPSGTLNTAGASIPITITYTKNGDNFDCIQNVEVVELSSISINTVPSKTRYIKGANFDPTGLKINLNYSDSSTEIVTYNTTTSVNFTFNGASTLTLNTVGNPFEITIGYAGKTCIQNVIVAELSSIAITTHATKLNYNAGETFDPSGLVITLNYSDSVTEPVAYNTTTSSDFEFSPNGPLTRTGNVITVTYAGKTTTETLNVKELTGITIATNPTKLSYATGQSLNPNGLVLTLTFTDSNNVNTSENVTYNSTTQSKFAFNPSGTAITTGNVTVTYDGKTGAGMQPTFAITVRTVASISVINRPSKTSYSSGEKLALSGLSIKVNYADGTNETVVYSSSNASDFSFNPSTSTSLNTGHTNVTVTYGGKSTSFAISVTQSSGGYVPSSGGGNNNGGGGGGGGGDNSFVNSIPVIYIESNYVDTERINDSNVSWNYNKHTGYWDLSFNNGNGYIKYGFYTITSIIKETINGIVSEKTIYKTYYFDSNGHMFFGWLHTLDGNWYFFDIDIKNLGMMIKSSWKFIEGKWYYFNNDGKLLVNTITPDGYVVDANGAWVP